MPGKEITAIKGQQFGIFLAKKLSFYGSYLKSKVFPGDTLTSRMRSHAIHRLGETIAMTNESLVQTADTNDAVDIFNAPIAQADPEIATILDAELSRQQDGLEMIASENFVPRAVLQAQGSVLTNKYAEGYPGRRYYGGCEQVDKIESIAQQRAKDLFGAEYANVQPHSGAQANAAVYQALVKPGDTILGLALDHGGHLTHGMKINFSGRFYHAEAYGVNPETFRIDPEIIRQRALETHPAMIIGGWSAYPRIEDFKAMKEIADEVGAKFWVDMAHFAGLVAAGLHPSPVPFADVVSSTAHKTLGGPRSGFILAKEEYAKKLNSAVFPGQQGGPLMHVIAGKAVAFGVAGTPAFKNRMERTLEGAKIIAERLNAEDVAANGISVLTGGTDVHLVMVDLRNSKLDGQQGEDLLASIGITINRNTVPFDPRPASVASGLRIGTAALATRGFGSKEFEEVADIIGTALAAGQQADVDTLKARVDKLVADFPLYPELNQTR
jgi:glycine hydroxymethyltransferase